MTICVAVKVAEGLVFAADSTTTIEGDATNPQGQTMRSVLQTFEFANKVTQVKDYPIGVMFWGMASIGVRTLQSLVMEFEYDYQEISQNKNYTVKKVATDLIKFLRERYDNEYPKKNNEPRPILGVLIEGYSSKQFFPEEYIYEFPMDGDLKLQIVRPDKPDGSPDFGANWYGQTDALTRLIKGYDHGAIEVLIKRGADIDIVQKWVDDDIAELPLIFDGMPLQDAVDFASYAINVVIGRWRFSVGPPTCGGDIDIAVIRPNSFDWAQKKQWAIK